MNKKEKDKKEEGELSDEEIQEKKDIERDKLRFCYSEKEGAQFKDDHDRIKRCSESVAREKE